MAQGWRVEFAWSRRKSGRRVAYFRYRRGSGRNRQTRYGGTLEKAKRLHPERVAAFLQSTRYQKAALEIAK